MWNADTLQTLVLWTNVEVSIFSFTWVLVVGLKLQPCVWIVLFWVLYMLLYFTDGLVCYIVCTYNKCNDMIPSFVVVFDADF